MNLKKARGYIGVFRGLKGNGGKMQYIITSKGKQKYKMPFNIIF